MDRFPPQTFKFGHEICFGGNFRGCYDVLQELMIFISMIYWKQSSTSHIDGFEVVFVTWRAYFEMYKRKQYINYAGERTNEGQKPKWRILLHCVEYSVCIFPFIKKWNVNADFWKVFNEILGVVSSVVTTLSTKIDTQGRIKTHWRPWSLNGIISKCALPRSADSYR